MYNNLHCAASRNFTIIQPSKFIPEPWLKSIKCSISLASVYLISRLNFPLLDSNDRFAFTRTFSQLTVGRYLFMGHQFRVSSPSQTLTRV